MQLVSTLCAPLTSETYRGGCVRVFPTCILTDVQVDDIFAMTTVRRKPTAECFDSYFWPSKQFYQTVAVRLVWSRWMILKDSSGCCRPWRKRFLALPEANWVQICIRSTFWTQWGGHLFHQMFAIKYILYVRHDAAESKTIQVFGWCP